MISRISMFVAASSIILVSGQLGFGDTPAEATRAHVRLLTVDETKAIGGRWVCTGYCESQGHWPECTAGDGAFCDTLTQENCHTDEKKVLAWWVDMCNGWPDGSKGCYWFVNVDCAYYETCKYNGEIGLCEIDTWRTSQKGSDRCF